MIPFNGLDRQYQNLKDEILDITDKVYSSGLVLDGIYTHEFEQRIATRCNRKYAVAVANGTQALEFAQKIIFGTEQNKKVLIPCISFVATLNTVISEKNIPVFCDVDKQGLINLQSLRSFELLRGVDCVMYVNLFGNTVDYNKFTTNLFFFNQKVTIIEDAAQSFGASFEGKPSGSLGTVSTLSFDPTKNLGNYGSGGMVLVDDVDDYKYLKSLRNNGKYLGYIRPATNSKMNEVDCAQLCIKLNYFDSWQKRRHDIASYYSAELMEHVEVPQTTKGTVHAWHKYVIKTKSRDYLSKYLIDKKITTKIHYENPLYDYPIGYPYINYLDEFYKESNKFSTECLSLPIYPELTDSEVEYITQSIKDYFVSQ